MPTLEVFGSQMLSSELRRFLDFMDNFSIDICGESEDDETEDVLAAAIKICLNLNTFSKKAVTYKEIRLAKKRSYFINAPLGLTPNVIVDGKDYVVHHYSEIVEDAEKGHLTLVLGTYENVPDMTPLPYPLDEKGIISFVKGWLREKGDPGEIPDIDGDVYPGWRIFTDYWGHVHKCSGAIFGIQAIWSLYGK